MLNLKISDRQVAATIGLTRSDPFPVASGGSTLK